MPAYFILWLIFINALTHSFYFFKANLNLGNLEDAFQDFTTLLSHHPENNSGWQQLEVAKQKMKAANDKQKFIFGGMFKKFAEHDARVWQTEYVLSEYELNLHRLSPPVYISLRLEV